MKTIAILSMSTMLGASAACAADLPTHKSPPAPNYPMAQPPFNWTGFYAGANGGYGWGSSGAGGGLVGGTLGYNYQINQYVIGVEGDIDFASINGNAGYPDGSYLKARLDSLMTERLRLGYAMDRTLFYVTGGYAGGNVRSSLWNGPGGFWNSQDSWRNGYALGGGVEYAFTDHISAKAEYLFTQLGSQTIYAGPVSGRSTMNVSLFRVGLNYHF